MEHTCNETQTTEVTKSSDGHYDSFTITLPAGDLQVKHLESYLSFLANHNTSDVLKTMITVFFTSLNDENIALSDEQKLHFEKSLVCLVDHLDVRLCKPH